MKANLRPAFYSLPSGAWRDYVSLLHLPYTLWHLSYAVIGAVGAPMLHLDRVGGLVLAFFLAVGLGAHALDEFRSRPLATRISNVRLMSIAVISISGALAIGVVASVTISLWAVPFVLFGGFIVVAYNLEWWSGRLHSDMWFSLAWGAFPALVGYWANAERLDIQALLIATACFALSQAQRTLSKEARRLRRNAQTVTGRIEFQDGRSEDITISRLLAAPETALRLMSFSIPLLALGLLVARL